MLEKRHASGRERLSVTSPLLHFVIAVVLVAVATVSTTMSTTNAAAAEPRKVEFNIPAQPIASALRTYARQARVQLLVLTEGLNAIQANAVVGRLDPRTALQMLLAGTGLQAEYRPDATVAVRRKSDAAYPVSSASGGARRGRAHLLARAWQDTEARTTTQSSESQQDEDAASDPDDVQNPGTDIEEIVVTGSNIRGVGAVGSASITFAEDELAKMGYSTLGELFESLPQNLATITPDGAYADGTGLLAHNSLAVTGINLRGLGPGSTLVLLNGKRRPRTVDGRVVDVSAIPLSMVERVEVVTGGRSAIYGSDAVAGVVNIVTVRELDGAESQVYYGESSAGGERFNFSQTLGHAYDDGGFVLGYFYRRAWPLDATDTGIVRAPSRFGLTPIPGLFNLRHPSEQHIGLFSGHYELGQNVELYADAHFSSDRNDVKLAFNSRGLSDTGQVIVTESDQYSAVGGIRFDAGEDWQIDLSALHGAVDNYREITSVVRPSGSITNLDLPFDNLGTVKTTLTSFSAIADGPLGRLWNATVSAAVGVDFRKESYESADITDPRMASVTENIDRDTWSVFGEVHLPLLDDNEQRLELSVAGRYDHYSDVGGTFNPQFGVEWEPISSFTFRGSYATAFRAPDLYPLNAPNFSILVTVDDPRASVSPGTATLLTEIGGNSDLQPEEADTWTVGVDWAPTEGTKLSLSYFSIDYQRRIAVPKPEYVFVLQEEMLYADLISRNPTPEQLDAILLDRQKRIFNLTTIPFDPATDDPLTAFPNLVVFDDRRANIALEVVNAIDVQGSTAFETQSGDWSFGLNGTYYFDLLRNVTVAAPAISQLNQPGRPVDLRVRGRVGWSRAAWSADTYINYVADYVDTFAATPTEIDSWTTVDLSLSVSPEAGRGFLNGMSATLGVNNVFDKDPPVFVSNRFALGYDPANANAIGRFISLRVSKRW